VITINFETYLNRIIELNDEYDLENLKKVFEFAKEAHRGQKRKSGEDFFIHPLEVSLILAEMKMDEETVIASILHDVIEDTKHTRDEINEMFSPTIGLLVDGVTKLGTIHYESKEKQKGENLRKMFLAMAKDIRVVLIKLADRLHNMRTLEYMSPAKKKEKALECLEIYAPIADRLGMSQIKWELEDTSLRFLHPDEYRELVDKVNAKRSEREAIIEKNIGLLKDHVDDIIDTDYEINGRAKHFYSIYKKMEDYNKDFDEIFDLTAIRVIVNDTRECYSVLGVCHSIWNPIPGRFKDYIAVPKSNLYQSLHTTVITQDGDTLEIQIRTKEMHRIAEFGIAAHWIYKGGKREKQENIDKKLAWIREVLENQNETSDPEQFMDSIKVDLYVNEVFVYTPNGDVFELPSGSTPIDFAYKVHSEVGHQCVGAKVNGKIVPLSYELSSGEIVSIITKKGSGPSRDWINLVQSNHAKNRIRRWFKKERRDENIEKGKAILESEMKKAHLSIKEDLKDKWIDPILKRLSLDTLEDLYEALGYGGILSRQVVPRIKEYKSEENKKREKFDPQRLQKSKKRKQNNVGVIVKGLDNALTRFAKCCNPLPGDDIIGYVTQGRGITVHRVDCPNLADLLKSKERFIEVEWDDSNKSSYEARVKVIGNDRKGLLSNITSSINTDDFVINGLNARKDKTGVATIELLVEISNKKHLWRLIEKLKAIDGVIDVQRVTS
jgi:GTP pyrophosphokinase